MTVLAASADPEILCQPAHDSIQRLFGYWQARRGERPLPLRAAIDPIDLRKDLPSLFMLDVIDDGRDFRYRLIGTTITDISGRDPTGASFSTLYADQPGTIGRIRRLFAPAIAEQRPVFARGQVFWLPERDYRHFEGGYFPVSSHGERADILLCQVSFS